MPIDDHGIECPNCDHWMHLHWTVLDGVSYETGKCPSCGQIVDEFPEDRSSTEHVLEEDSYPGKGLYIVTIDRPGEKREGCRFETYAEARAAAWAVPIIPCGSVSLICPGTESRKDVTRKWPTYPKEMGSAELGRRDAIQSSIQMMRAGLDKGILPKCVTFMRLSDAVKDADMYGWGASHLYSEVAVGLNQIGTWKGEVTEESALKLIAELETMLANDRHMMWEGLR